ncbi:MAG: hypothetical protein IT165_35455 [Bryobacterales bacterium]|nr:hypothetical protein [Bryobacterales bacterium]
MQDIIIRDVRLLGWKPAGKEVLEVNFDTPIEWPINWAADKSDTYKGDVRIRIMAHGFETYVRTEGSDANGMCTEKNIYSQGGAGIQFCKENITISTISRFAKWKGKVKAIELLSCGAAYITPGKEGKQGDGNYFCYRFAQITGASVRASTATQRYSYGTKDTGIEFGRWEGMVYTYDSTGAVVKVEKEPET